MSSPTYTAESVQASDDMEKNQRDTGAFFTGFVCSCIAAVVGIVLGFSMSSTLSFDGMLMTTLATPIIILIAMAVVVWRVYRSREGVWGVLAGGLLGVVGTCVLAMYALGNMQLSM